MLRHFTRNAPLALRCQRFASAAPVANDNLTTIKENNGVREITLNQPKTRNSLSIAMMDSLIEGLSTNVSDESLRCIVLSSTGSIFSSGHNLKELTPEKGADYHRIVFKKCAEMIQLIQKVPVPVIAKVDGHAAAAGCQMVASCDIVVCSKDSSFSTPGANFGIFYHTPGVAVGRVMSRTKALHMLFSGNPLTAQEAYIAGLVSVVVPAEKLDAEVVKICDSIKHKSRAVIAMGKDLFNKQIQLGLADAYNLASEAMVANLSSNDGKEGIRSFVEKRKPKWTHL